MRNLKAQVVLISIIQTALAKAKGIPIQQPSTQKTQQNTKITEQQNRQKATQKLHPTAHDINAY
jgi:hypothetical protein